MFGYRRNPAGRKRAYAYDHIPPFLIPLPLILTHVRLIAFFPLCRLHIPMSPYRPYSRLFDCYQYRSTSPSPFRLFPLSASLPSPLPLPHVSVLGLRIVDTLVVHRNLYYSPAPCPASAASCQTSPSYSSLLPLPDTRSKCRCCSASDSRQYSRLHVRLHTGSACQKTIRSSIHLQAEA